MCKKNKVTKLEERRMRLRLVHDENVFFFLREFQPMTFAPNDSSLSLDQDTNQFFGVGGD